MKKLILILALILAMQTVSAYQVKYYSDKINQTECEQIFQSIPSAYFKGIKRISIMEVDNHHLAGEYYPNVIYSLVGCDRGVIIHELAHHLQFTRKDTWGQLVHHSGHFNQYEKEITEGSI